MTRYNLDNIAEHLKYMGYNAKAKSFTRESGEIAEIVEFRLGSHVNAYLDFSHNAMTPELKVFGNLKDGYAPVLTDEGGKALRYKTVEEGREVWKARRGEKLDTAALKKKNGKIAVQVRKDITGPALAAFLIEAHGGDLPAVKSGFRLQKWEPTRGQDATEENTGGELDGFDGDGDPFDFPQATTSGGGSAPGF